MNADGQRLDEFGARLDGLGVRVRVRTDQRFQDVGRGQRGSRDEIGPGDRDALHAQEQPASRFLP